MHLPVGIRGPSEDKAAGDELRDDSGTKALRSSEQSGLAGSFSILAHYFATSSASFHTLNLDYFNSLVKPGTEKKQNKIDLLDPKLQHESAGRARRASHSESAAEGGGTLNCEWPRA